MLNPVSHPPFLNGLKIFPSEFLPNNINVRYNKTILGYKRLMSYQFVFDVFLYKYFIYFDNKKKFCKTKKIAVLKKCFLNL